MPTSGNDKEEKSADRETRAFPTRQFLIFKIDNEEFGVEILDLQEIIRFREITAVPHAGKDVEGILSLRGKIVTVINGRKRLERKEKKNAGAENSSDALTPRALSCVSTRLSNISPVPHRRSVPLKMSSALVREAWYMSSDLIIPRSRRFLESMKS